MRKKSACALITLYLCTCVFVCCSPVSFQYQCFSIFFTAASIYLRAKHECLRCLEEIFQPIELSARAESFMKSKATDRLFWRALQSELTMPYRTTTATVAAASQRYQQQPAINHVQFINLHLKCRWFHFFPKPISMNTCRWISTQPFATHRSWQCNKMRTHTQKTHSHSENGERAPCTLITSKMHQCKQLKSNHGGCRRWLILMKKKTAEWASSNGN